MTPMEAHAAQKAIQRERDKMTALTEAEKAAIKAFENDLNSMTKQEMREELSEVQDLIDRETAWAEALSAAIKEEIE